MKKRSPTVVVLSIVIVILASALLFNSDILPKEEIQKQFEQEKLIQTNASEKIITISVPAVDADGNGVVGAFKVQAVKGDGKTLTNIDNLLFFVDTQFSIQTAKSVASNITGIDISEYNIIYEVQNERQISSVIEGPSAGAALTIATIAALENRELDESVLITGTVQPDGTIGRIGGIEAKIDAARNSGASVLLIPEGQGPRPDVKVETNCMNFEGGRFCETEYKQQKSITDINGIVVEEVSDVSEALKYFLP